MAQESGFPKTLEVLQNACSASNMELDKISGCLTPNLRKSGLTTSSSVHELLECPVCTNSMYPPIHQCPNGHTLCSDCKARVHNRCPTCRY
eukprot:c30466_g1_i1 orf=1-270(-)